MEMGRGWEGRRRVVGVPVVELLLLLFQLLLVRVGGVAACLHRLGRVEGHTNSKYGVAGLGPGLSVGRLCWTAWCCRGNDAGVGLGRALVVAGWWMPVFVRGRAVSVSREGDEEPWVSTPGASLSFLRCQKGRGVLFMAVPGLQARVASQARRPGQAGHYLAFAPRPRVACACPRDHGHIHCPVVTRSIPAGL